MLTRSHYNDYSYNLENDAFENIEDGHNILEAFTRDIMSDYNGYPDLSSLCYKHIR
mgnify:FL=1